MILGSLVVNCHTDTLVPDIALSVILSGLSGLVCMLLQATLTWYMLAVFFKPFSSWFTKSNFSSTLSSANFSFGLH